MVLRVQVIQVLFGYGRFDEVAIERTRTALLSPPSPCSSELLIAILARAFYAGRADDPDLAAVLAVAINTVVAVLTVGAAGPPWRRPGHRPGSIAEALFLAVRPARRVPGFDPLSIVRSRVPAGAAALAAAAVSALAVTGVLGVAGGAGRSGVPRALVLATAAGGLVYLGVGRILRIAELDALLALARSRRPPDGRPS